MMIPESPNEGGIKIYTIYENRQRRDDSAKEGGMFKVYMTDRNRQMRGVLKIYDAFEQ